MVADIQCWMVNLPISRGDFRCDVIAWLRRVSPGDSKGFLFWREPGQDFKGKRKSALRYDIVLALLFGEYDV